VTRITGITELYKAICIFHHCWRNMQPTTSMCYFFHSLQWIKELLWKHLYFNSFVWPIAWQE